MNNFTAKNLRTQMKWINSLKHTNCQNSHLQAATDSQSFYPPASAHQSQTSKYSPLWEPIIQAPQSPESLSPHQSIQLSSRKLSRKYNSLWNATHFGNNWTLRRISRELLEITVSWQPCSHLNPPPCLMSLIPSSIKHLSTIYPSAMYVFIPILPCASSS